LRRSLRSEAGGEETRRGAISGFLGWLPILAGLGLLTQLGLAGLRPALVEHQRLRTAEEHVLKRHQQLLEEDGRLHDAATMWEDPVFRERLRRMKTAQR